MLNQLFRAVEVMIFQGVAILISAGPSVAAVLKPALYGTVTAVRLCTLAHLMKL